MPELHDYVNADIRLDPEHDDLPREQVFKFEEKVIESRVQRSNSAKIWAEIHVLKEHMQDRDSIAAQMAANVEQEEGSPRGEQEGEDPTAFELRAKGKNLYEIMSHTDTFEKNIRLGYQSDPFFQKVLKKMGKHPSYKKLEGIIWTKNRGEVDIVCVPSVISTVMTLRMRILEQAHQVVGHYRTQHTSDYVR